MKLYYLSDIHLEFFDDVNKMALHGIEPQRYLEHLFENIRGEVLLVAGDTLGEMAHPHPLLNLFFKLATAHFDQVCCVLGNHDYWGKVAYEQVLPKVRADHPKIVFLENDTVTLSDDCLLFGAAFWTHVSDKDRAVIEAMMPDFWFIRHEDGSCLTVKQANAVCSQSLSKLKTVCERNPHKKIVVLSHHTPSFLSVENRFKDSPLNPGFCNEFDGFITEHPNIAAWIHGHVHNCNDYRIGKTRIVSNPHGYILEEVFPENGFRIRSIEI